MLVAGADALDVVPACDGACDDGGGCCDDDGGWSAADGGAGCVLDESDVEAIASFSVYLRSFVIDN